MELKGTGQRWFGMTIHQWVPIGFPLESVIHLAKFVSYFAGSFSASPVRPSTGVDSIFLPSGCKGKSLALEL